MPRTLINYNNTIFYQIVCRDTTIKDCYVGHTTDFNRRKSDHKSACNNQNSRNHNICLYKFIRDNGGWDNFDMILIETRECANSLDARKIERGHIEEYNSTLNVYIPSRTFKEWQQENKEMLAINNKEYREINQE
jgi:predicted GIY-YIG superfamily endonuclease